MCLFTTVRILLYQLNCMRLRCNFIFGKTYVSVAVVYYIYCSDFHNSNLFWNTSVLTVRKSYDLSLFIKSTRFQWRILKQKSYHVETSFELMI